MTGIGDAPPAAAKGPLTQRPAPKSVVPARYGRAATTPLEVEVVASPTAGAYDLTSSRRPDHPQPGVVPCVISIAKTAPAAASR